MGALYQIHQLDKKLAAFTSIKKLSTPKDGWISAIRNTLGMSQSQLAQRLNLSRSRMKKIEESETKGSLKFSTLRKVAECLGCEAHYLLVPKNKSLVEFVNQQAESIAKKAVMKSAQHMILENQEALREIKQQINLLTQELLHQKLKNLWKQKK